MSHLEDLEEYDAELELMATAGRIEKLSARDLPVAAAKGIHGATTVAATDDDRLNARARLRRDADL